jgi:GH15 family glucan-1,4-alpha-glucosidase
MHLAAPVCVAMSHEMGPAAGAPAPDPFPAISDYGLIGDCGSAALISRDGAVEWMCLPSFDSPALFAAVLDRERGGRFQIAPVARYTSTRRYVDGTAVLETELRTETGAIRIRDCMVALATQSEVGALWPEHQLLREVRCIDGRVEVEVVCEPRFDFGRRRIAPEHRGKLGIFFQHCGHVAVLESEIPLDVHAGGARGRETLAAGDRRYVLLAYDQSEPATIPPLGDCAAQNLEGTVRFWRDWSGRCGYGGPYREQVVRSAITLKLMTFAASGAIVAAPTTSLPERIGGVRNWDYRYTWLRDACFTLRALFELGYVEEGTAFFSWMLHAAHHSRARLRVLYSVFGRRVGREQELTHLCGYRGSRPVRIRNAAEDQLQLDLYGELAACAFEYVRRGGQLGAWSGRQLVRLGDRVCKVWTRPDQGIWEARSPPKRRVLSAAMCAVALDRILDMSRDGGVRLSRRRRERFERTSRAIRATIERRGWSPEQRSFVSVLDGSSVDASLLLLGLYGYLDPCDPRMQATFDRVCRELGEGPLLHRYPPAENDGLPAGEAAFGICSFWAVEHLAHVGQVDEAEARLEGLLECANDLGLFGEEIDPDTGAPLGNFPQAFTHVGLVSAALAIDAARGARPSTELAGREPRPVREKPSDAHETEDLFSEKERT